MIKCACDRCGQIIEIHNAYHISYTSHDEADLCKACFEELSNWIKNKPVKDYDKKIEDYQRKIEDYRKSICNYNNHITYLTEKLDKTRESCDWWKTQCKEFYEDYKVLSEKLNNMFLYGSDAE